MTQHKRRQTENESEYEEMEQLQEEVAADEVSALRLDIESLKEQLARQQDQYLRALADFDNYKKRHEAAYDRHIQVANQELILKLLPAIDNFERALAAARETESFEALAEGVDLTLRQLRDLLAAEGVEVIPTVGEPFDPNVHEAVMSVTTDEAPDHTVVEEFERGYTHKDKVIRPAKVKVAVNS